LSWETWVTHLIPKLASLQGPSLSFNLSNLCSDDEQKFIITTPFFIGIQHKDTTIKQDTTIKRVVVDPESTLHLITALVSWTLGLSDLHLSNCNCTRFNKYETNPIEAIDLALTLGPKMVSTQLSILHVQVDTTSSFDALGWMLWWRTHAPSWDNSYSLMKEKLVWPSAIRHHTSLCECLLHNFIP
jgi:hypothetical protein